MKSWRAKLKFPQVAIRLQSERALLHAAGRIVTLVTWA